jgi:hypothetical protein
MEVRLGIPPLDIIPGFQEKFLSDGITIWASASLTTPSSRNTNAQLLNLLDMMHFLSRGLVRRAASKFVNVAPYS